MTDLWEFADPTFSDVVKNANIGVEVSRQKITFEFVIDSFKVGQFSILEKEIFSMTLDDWKSITASISSKAINGHGTAAVVFSNKINGSLTTMRINAFKNSISMRSFDGDVEQDDALLLMLRLPFKPFQDALVKAFEKIINDLKNEK